MRQLTIEHAAAIVSDMDPNAEGHVLLLMLGMDYGEMTGLQVRDLADLRPIITSDAFDALCARQNVMLSGLEGTPDFDQIRWMSDALSRIAPRCSAPVMILHFVDGTLERISSSVEYSAPSGLKVARDARKAA